MSIHNESLQLVDMIASLRKLLPKGEVLDSVRGDNNVEAMQQIFRTDRMLMLNTMRVDVETVDEKGIRRFYEIVTADNTGEPMLAMTQCEQWFTPPRIIGQKESRPVVGQTIVIQMNGVDQTVMVTSVGASMYTCESPELGVVVIPFGLSGVRFS